MFKAMCGFGSSLLVKDSLRISIGYCKVQTLFNLNQDRAFSSNTDEKLLDLLNDTGDANKSIRFVDYIHLINKYQTKTFSIANYTIFVNHANYRSALNSNQINNLESWKRENGDFKTLNDVKSVRGIGKQSMDKLVKLCGSNRELYEPPLGKANKGKDQFDGKCYSQLFNSVFEIPENAPNQQLKEPPLWTDQFEELCQPQLYQAIAETGNINQEDGFFEIPAHQQQHEHQSNELCYKKNDPVLSNPTQFNEEKHTKARLPNLQIRPQFVHHAIKSYTVMITHPSICAWAECAPISEDWVTGIRVVNWNAFCMPTEYTDLTDMYSVISDSYDMMPSTNHYIFLKHSERAISKNAIAAVRNAQIDASLITMLHERKQGDLTVYNMKPTAMGTIFRLSVGSENEWCRNRIERILGSKQDNDGARSYENKTISFRISIDDDQINRYNNSPSWIKEFYGRALLQAATVYTLRLRR